MKCFLFVLRLIIVRLKVMIIQILIERELIMNYLIAASFLFVSLLCVFGSIYLFKKRTVNKYSSVNSFIFLSVGILLLMYVIFLIFLN